MLRVWTKWYKAFNTGQISVLGSAMWGCGCRETERQKLNNLLFPRLFTSPPPSSFSRLLSFPHVCLLTISCLVHPPPFSAQSSFILRTHLSIPRSCILSQPSMPPSSLHPTPIVTFFFLPVSSHPSFSVPSNFHISKSIQNMNTLAKHWIKHPDRKYWNAHCSVHKDAQLKLITSFFKCRGVGEKCGFTDFNSSFVEQPFNALMHVFACAYAYGWDEMEFYNWGFSKWADCCSDCKTHKGQMDEMRDWRDKGRMQRWRGRESRMKERMGWGQIAALFWCAEWQIRKSEISFFFISCMRCLNLHGNGNNQVTDSRVGD